ncbi:hypothetical protein PB01_08600 [Psychrobacillus glaciei]|uniref:Uncharacterized protein n=1 Tax=Psychrobacillus glaciei TaxID=2283160 RepID=A0A5J6SRT6_9BACI|nr:hypothetical protein PB01_08600 [Psychrobacillus glaciei]
MKLLFKGYGRDFYSAVITAYTIALGINSGVTTTNAYGQLSQIGSHGTATTQINLIVVGAKGTLQQKIVYGQVEIFLDVPAPYTESTMWNVGEYNSALGGENVENFTKVVGYRKFSELGVIPSWIHIQHTGMALGVGTLEIWGGPR